jgi:hypothetical protein
VSFVTLELGAIFWPLSFYMAVRYVANTTKAIADKWSEQKPKAAAPQDLIKVPEDLIALALNERETWAQEETLRAIRERYEDLQDWNAVRAAIGVAMREGE